MAARCGSMHVVFLSNLLSLYCVELVHTASQTLV